MALPQAVPCPGEPPARLRSASIEPGGRTLPQVLRRVGKVQDPRGRASKALVKQAPYPPAAITEPDHLGSAPDTLAQRFEPETRLEGLDVPQDGHQPALCQPSDHLPCPRTMLGHPGEYAHFDLAPSDLPPRRASVGSKRHHHAIGT